MKKNIKKILIYLCCFILLFLLGVAISDTVIIARAKYLLHIADSLNFEKNIQKAYPVIPPERNGFAEFEKIAAALDKLPPEMWELDRKLNSELNKISSVEEQKKFWENPQVSAIANSLPSIPYNIRFDLGYGSGRGNLPRSLQLIRRLHIFYVNYLKFSASQGDKLQILLIFQNLITLNRSLERQNLASCEYLRQDLWISALDALVHYGPTEKRYEEYYLSLQKLVQSLDFEYCPQLTVLYNNLKIALANTDAGDTLIEKHKNYITSIKEATGELRNSLLQYPLPPDMKRNPPLYKDIFFKQKSVVQSQLQILMHLKLYQLKNGFFPEAIEGFPVTQFADNLLYKRISPNDFVLKQKL